MKPILGNIHGFHAQYGGFVQRFRNAHLQSAGRPLSALCGMELRSPKPFRFSGFDAFNASYVELLKKWGLLVNGINPIARTNVAPAVNPPKDPSLYDFSYTVRSSGNRQTFVVAGAGELPEGSLDPRDVVRAGESSPTAIQEKMHFVIGPMEGRLRGLGVTWNDVTVSEIYSVHDIYPFLETELLNRQQEGGAHGLHGTTLDRRLRTSNTRWIFAAVALNW